MATIQIADNDARKQYTQAVTANSTQLVIDFPFFSLDDIQVVVTSAAGADTTLTRGTGAGTFAVVGTAVDDGFSGGYVTLGDTYSDAATKFTIFRDIPIARTTDFPTSGPFNIASLNTQLDKIFAIEQELETQITRSFKLPESDSGTAVLPNVAARSNKYLAFDSNGNPIASDGTVNATPINSAMQPFVQSSNVTDARALLLAGSNLTIPSGGFNTTIQSTGDINLTPGSNDQVIVNTDGTRSFQAGNVKIEDNLISAANGQGELRLEPNGAGPLLINGTATVTEDTSTGTILSVHGTNTQGMIELVSEASGTVSSADVGKIQFNMTNNDATFKRCAEIAVTAEGATNSQRGGNILFKTRDNAATAMTEHMRLTREGRLGIGNNTPGSPLHVKSAANEQLVQIEATASSYTTNMIFIKTNKGASNSHKYLKINHNSGTVSEATSIQIIGNGNVQNANNSYGSISDQRIKQDLTDASSQWEDIKALNFKNYKEKHSVSVNGDDAPVLLGLIAQDLESAGMNGLVETVEPDPYQKDTLGITDDVKAVKYSILYLKAVKALQEAITKIEALEARVTTLENA